MANNQKDMELAGLFIIIFIVVFLVAFGIGHNAGVDRGKVECLERRNG